MGSVRQRTSRRIRCSAMGRPTAVVHRQGRHVRPIVQRLHPNHERPAGQSASGVHRADRRAAEFLRPPIQRRRVAAERRVHTRAVRHGGDGSAGPHSDPRSTFPAIAADVGGRQGPASASPADQDLAAARPVRRPLESRSASRTSTIACRRRLISSAAGTTTSSTRTFATSRAFAEEGGSEAVRRELGCELDPACTERTRLPQSSISAGTTTG